MTRFKVGRSKSDDVVGGRGEGGSGGWKLAIVGRSLFFPLHFNSNGVQHPVYEDTVMKNLPDRSCPVRRFHDKHLHRHTYWTPCSEGITKVEH